MATPRTSESARPTDVLHRLRDPVLRGIAYNNTNQRLVLGFRNGVTVEYSCVPRLVYDAFIDAQPRSWAAAGSLLRRYRQREISPIPISG
jgi:KTSC domain-containing protein